RRPPQSCRSQKPPRRSPSQKIQRPDFLILPREAGEGARDSTNSFDESEAARPAPLPPSCFARWSPSPAALRYAREDKRSAVLKRAQPQRFRRSQGMDAKMTIATLQQMKRAGQKSIGVVAWDYQIARIADRAGVDFVSVGDSVGVNLWGREEVAEVTLDEMLICCQAVRRGVTRALVSCDMPFGPVQESVGSALAAARRLVKDGGADMIKVDAAADYPQVVRALVDAGIPVFAQFGLTPQTAIKYGIPYSAQNSAAAQATAEAAERLVAEAKLLEKSGAALLDFTNSGPLAGAAVVK